jgi:hypothetical protein
VLKTSVESQQISGVNLTGEMPATSRLPATPCGFDSLVVEESELKKSTTKICHILKPVSVEGARRQITALPFLAIGHDAAVVR